QISASLAGMSRMIDDYDSMAQTEIIKAKQEKATSYDYAEFRKEFERIKEEVHSPLHTAVQRTELFSTSTGTPLTPGAGRRRFATGASTSMQSDTAPENPLREAHVLHKPDFIRSTEMRLDEFLAEGWEELNNLVDQRTILKGMQRRLRDAASTLTPSRVSLAGSSAEVCKTCISSGLVPWPKKIAYPTRTIVFSWYPTQLHLHMNVTSACSQSH
ncbi:hypothetical protein EDB86DRAFT_2837720, partial [Lactarius hatsudake]